MYSSCDLHDNCFSLRLAADWASCKTEYASNNAQLRVESISKEWFLRKNTSLGHSFLTGIVAVYVCLVYWFLRN